MIPRWGGLLVFNVVYLIFKCLYLLLTLSSWKHHWNDGIVSNGYRSDLFIQSQ